MDENSHDGSPCYLEKNQTCYGYYNAPDGLTCIQSTSTLKQQSSAMNAALIQTASNRNTQHNSNKIVAINSGEKDCEVYK